MDVTGDSEESSLVGMVWGKASLQKLEEDSFEREKGVCVREKGGDL